MRCRENRQQRRIFVSVLFLDGILVVSFFLFLVVFILRILILSVVLGEVCGGMSSCGVWGGEWRMFFDASARLLRAKQGREHC
jgi:hypothetical protein